MMRTLLKSIALVAVIGLLAAMVGCGGGASTASTAAAVGGSLYQSLGGADGVTKLANQFGANIKSNSTLNSLLDATVIGALQSGLTNDIMSASGLKPNSATTMASALQGTNLGADGLAALSSSLNDAGKSMNLNAATLTSLTGLLKPLSKSVGM